MKKNNFLFVLLLLLSLNNLQAQIHSKYGYTGPTKDTIRVFLVFAEALNDPWYNDENRDGVEDLYDYDNWNPNEMPKYPENWFDSNFTTESAIHAYITKYYHQTSFGNIEVVGDYYPNLVQIEYDDITWSGGSDVTNYLHNIGGGVNGDIITQNGYHINNNTDFDKWTKKTVSYQESIQNPDDNIDFLIIVWRVNEKFARSGGISFGYTSRNLINKVGSLASIILISNEGSPGTIPRHEFSHALLGGNDFHAVANGEGKRKIMAVPSGWGLLSLWWSDRGQMANAWDRWRLDWKTDENRPDISALDTSLNIVDTDINYDTTNTTQEFILRDFAVTGDAIRIKLPYLQSSNTEVLNQYIWLENHQLNEAIEIRKKNSTKGVYAYIQIGKDDREFTTPHDDGNQYIYPLNAFGNFDMTYTNIRQGTGKSYKEYGNEEDWYNDSPNKSEVHIDIGLKNPLTGANLLLEHPYNFRDNTIDDANGNPQIYTDIITRNELLNPDEVFYNGVALPDTDFCTGTHPIRGTRYDAFTVGRKISMNTNPPNTPVYTYETVSSDNELPNEISQPWDNQKIYLNGLAIEIMEQYSNGNVRVKISYNNYDISEDTRWCGDIVLNEKVNLLEGIDITFDQGLTPTRPRFPQIINGEQVFADPTVFTCNADSEFVQNENSTVSVKDNGMLHLKTNSNYLIKDGATLTIKGGSTLIIDSCAKLSIEGTGKLILEDDAIVEIGDFAYLDFEDALGSVILGANITFTNLDFTSVMPDHYIITTNSSWDNINYNLYSDVVVQEGVELIVSNNSILKAKDDVIILVKEGGKMILNNSTATSLGSCHNYFWKGIRVEGNSDETQTPESKQGVLEINNGSIVEFAEIGVYVGDSRALMNKGQDAPGTVWHGKSGGILRVDNVVFKDNFSGIEMPKYRKANNVSFIKNSQFVTTESLFAHDSPTSPDTFISLWDIGTITIENNTFENELDFLSHGPVFKQGQGIRVTDADAIISSNTFTNLYGAVYVAGTESLTSTVVDANDFIGNIVGVMIKGNDNVTVTSNTFNIQSAVYLGLSVKLSGLYIIDSKGFHIENNIIHVPTGSESQINRGIYIKDCRAINEIYRNTFTNLDVGIYSDGVNQSPSRGLYQKGLEIICNEFNDNITDIYVKDTPGEYDGIAQIQGSSQLSAGNKFMRKCAANGVSEFNNQAMQINYYGEGALNCSNEYMPTYNYGVNLSPNNIANPCLSKLTKHISDDDIANKDSEINQTDADLHALTDGGDTESLYDEVEDAEYNEALNLRNELLSKSPTLSDSVMVNTTNIEDVLPALMVKQVLAANPKAAKSVSVQSALDNRQNPLPEYMRSEINLGKNTFSYKESLESKLSLATHQRENFIDRRMIQLKREGSSVSLDSLEVLLVTEASSKLNRNYQLVDYYLTQNNVTEALSVFTAIPTNFNLSSSQQNKYDKLNQLYSIRFNLENADKTWFEMDSTQKGVIETLAIDSSSTAGIQARNILSLIDRMEYGCYIPDVTTGDYQSKPYNEPAEKIFKAYPEVATDYFIIEYVLGKNENPEEVSITVFDDQGNQLKDFDVKTNANQFLIECENWKEGVYWCRKSVGKKVTEHQKVIINKGGIVIDSVDANSVKGTNSLVLFPNPTSGYLFVSYKIENNTKTNIQISNTKGELIAEYKLKTNLTRIATDKWQQGVYVVNIIANNKIVDTAKIIVE